MKLIALALIPGAVVGVEPRIRYDSGPKVDGWEDAQ